MTRTIFIDKYGSQTELNIAASEVSESIQIKFRSRTGAKEESFIFDLDPLDVPELISEINAAVNELEGE